MSFVRTEVKERLWRWRESLFGGFLAGCGMYWAVATSGILAAIGTCLAIVSAIIIVAGIQQSRFRVGDGGPGVVQVDERRVTYYGPLDGGSVSIDALQKVELDPSARPSVWLLTETGNPRTLSIPTNAANAEVLFDVFATLDGIRTENMLDKLQAHPNSKVAIWDSGQRQLH